MQRIIMQTSRDRYELKTSYGTENVMKGLHVFGSHTYQWGGRLALGC
jgi:hypothetical protein